MEILKRSKIKIKVMAMEQRASHGWFKSITENLICVMMKMPRNFTASFVFLCSKARAVFIS